MRVIVDIVLGSPDRPPLGAAIRVEARDTTLQDVAAETISAVEGQVRAGDGPWLERVVLDLAPRTGSMTIWAHVDLNGDGRVSLGDYVTMVSYPITLIGDDPLEVSVRRV